MKLPDLQRTPIKLTLSFLLLVEILIIAFYFNSPAFATYLAVLAVLLCGPLSYYIYQYLRISLRIDHPEVKVYEALARHNDNSTELTNQAIKQLEESQQYKLYRQKVQKCKNYSREREDNEEQISEEQRKRIEEIEEIMAELQDKETQIFDLFE